MQDQVQIWRAYRAGKRSNASLYLAAMMSIIVHLLIALLAVYMFWQGASNFYVQQNIAQRDEVYMVELVESVYAPEAKLAKEEVLSAGNAEEIDDDDAADNNHNSSKTAEQEQTEQVRYSQMISSKVHQVLAKQPWRRRKHNATLEMMLEISEAGMIKAVTIVHANNIGKAELDSVTQGVMALKLPPPLDGRAGKYLVPVSFE